MRIYDGKYLSVTSIIDLREPFDKSSFKRWCEQQGLNEALISSTSRILGEKVSTYLDNTCKGLGGITAPQVDDLESRLLAGVDDFTRKCKLLDTEVEVVCESLRYAGRLDGIIERGRVRYLVDWKTYGAWKKTPYKRDSGKLKHVRWQLSLYAYAIDWIGKLAVVVFKNNGSWEMEEVKFDNEMIKWVEDNQKLILEVVENEKANKKA